MKAPAVPGNAERAPRPRVLGVDADRASRCAHYHSELDIIAIRARCCGDYYACKDCHDALADHPLAPWPVADFGTRAVLCGECGTQLTITEYLDCGGECTVCGARFNPRCVLHHHFYFESEAAPPAPPLARKRGAV